MDVVKKERKKISSMKSELFENTCCYVIIFERMEHESPDYMIVSEEVYAKYKVGDIVERTITIEKVS